MKAVLRRLAISFVLFSSVICGASLSNHALAWNPFGTVCNNAKAKGSVVCKTDNKDPVTGAEKEGVLIKAARILLMVVGVVSVIFIIIGGVQFVSSTGDPAKVSRARDTIIYALVGLVVAIVAGSIIQFVLTNLYEKTNAKITNHPNRSGHDADRKPCAEPSHPGDGWRSNQLDHQNRGL
jgi:uncharacterized membrane protein